MTPSNIFQKAGKRLKLKASSSILPLQTNTRRWLAATPLSLWLVYTSVRISNLHSIQKNMHTGACDRETQEAVAAFLANTFEMPLEQVAELCQSELEQHLIKSNKA